MLQILFKLWLIGIRTSCRPIRSVIILVIKQIGLPLRGRPILLITRMITDGIGLHSVLLPLLICFQRLYNANTQALLNITDIYLPRTQTSLFDVRAKEGGKEITGETAVCTLPMVPCGSSPVTRVLRSPLPCEKRSAWGGGWIFTI